MSYSTRSTTVITDELLKDGTDYWYAELKVWVDTDGDIVDSKLLRYLILDERYLVEGEVKLPEEAVPKDASAIDAIVPDWIEDNREYLVGHAAEEEAMEYHTLACERADARRNGW